MDFFEGKKAVVTGAAQGIGHGIATALYKYKAKVVAVDKDEEGLQALKGQHPEMETITVDLSDWDKTRDTFQGIKDIDILVNNAGIDQAYHFLDVPKEAMDKIFNINFFAAVNTMQVVGKSMKERGRGGSIVNIASISSAKFQPPGIAMYSATKAALATVTKCAAIELGQHKIRVNSVHPAPTKTRMIKGYEEALKVFTDRTSLGRLNEVDDVVGPVLFLLNDKMSAMVQGEQLFVDGGYN